MEEITFLIFILSMMLIVAAVSLWSIRPKKKKPICRKCGNYTVDDWCGICNGDPGYDYVDELEEQ